MKKVLFIAYIFPPTAGSGSQRTAKFVKYLSCFDWQPVVLTVKNDIGEHRDNDLLADVPTDVVVYRSRTFSPYTLFSSNNDRPATQAHESSKSTYNSVKLSFLRCGERVVRFFCFPDQAIFWLFSALRLASKIIQAEKIDILYSTSEPFTNHIVAWYMHKKYRLPWVADFRDEWTQNPFRSYQSVLHKKLHQWLERRILRNAQIVLSVTEPITKAFSTLVRGYDQQKFRTITNGYDDDDIPSQQTDNKYPFFHIVYTGSFYGDQSPENFLLAVRNLLARHLIDGQLFRVTLVGMIAAPLDALPILKDPAIQSVVKNVGYANHRQSIAFCGDADALFLVVGNKRGGATFTAKIFEYLAMGKPILALVPPDGVAARLLVQANNAYIADPDALPEIEQQILALYTKWRQGSLLIQPNWDIIHRYRRTELAGQLAKVFTEVAGNHSRDRQERK